MDPGLGLGIDWLGEMLRKSIHDNEYKAGATFRRYEGCVGYGYLDEYE
jgi:hypothetical protein